MSTTHGPSDLSGLSCETSREMISADADGELRAADRLRLSVHVETCAACERYADQVAVLTRQSRLRPVTADVDLVERVMANARPTRLGRGGWVRPALAWCGVVVAIQSVRPLVFGDLADTPTHVARHIGASALALAIGFLFAAWRPHRAQGMLPLVAALLVSTLFGSLLDMVDGSRGAGAESVHVAELLGMLLIWWVAGSPGWERLRAGFGRLISSTAGASPSTT